MRKAAILSVSVILAFFLFQGRGIAQSKAEIQNIDFNQVNDTLFITYDLVKARSGEKFNIVLIIKSVTGKTFETNSVGGDVGNNVVGGKGKKIYWNMVKDKAVIEDEIYVQVLATALPDATAAPGQEPAAQQQSVKQEKVFSKGGAIALSAIVPGLGISKLRDGGAYWLICLPVYGLAAGGIVLNVMSNSTYDKYKNSTDGSERSSLYDKAVSQNKTGNTLLWVAGGLWLADLIITAVVPAKPKFGYSLGPGWDPNINQPMLTFRCRIGK